MAKGSTAPTATADTDWRTQDDHRTLMDAQDIHADPVRLRGVRKHAQKQLRRQQRLAASFKSTKKLGGGR